MTHEEELLARQIKSQVYHLTGRHYQLGLESLTRENLIAFMRFIQDVDAEIERQKIYPWRK